MGRVGRPHGLDGSVHIEGHGGVVPLRTGIEIEVGGRPAVIVERRGTAERPILRLDLASDRDGAEAMRGQELSVPAALLPLTEGDEFFHVDLIGCSVRSRRPRARQGPRRPGLSGERRARRAADDGSEPVLVPFAEDVVTGVDIPERVVTIREDFL